MGKLSERLADHRAIGLDTSVFIYHLEAHTRYLPLTQELLSGIQVGRWTGITSTVTLMEVTVPAWQAGREAVARQYDALIANFPHMVLAEIDRPVARQAAQLRARFRIRPADALQVASGLVHGATIFVTNDRALERLQPVIAMLILDDFAGI
jgi:predicted nucleic acid-binding protein